MDEQLKLERWLQNMAPLLEVLHHEMVYAQATIDVEGIKAAHDAHIDAKLDCHSRIAAAYSELFSGFQGAGSPARSANSSFQGLRRPGTAEPRHPGPHRRRSGPRCREALPGAMGLSMLLFQATSGPLTNGDLERMMSSIQV